MLFCITRRTLICWVSLQLLKSGSVVKHFQAILPLIFIYLRQQSSWFIFRPLGSLCRTLNFSALVPHLLRAFLFIKLKMFVFLHVFIEKWHFQFLSNWFCMLIFFLLAPQRACAAFLQSLSVLSPCFYLSHNSLWFQGFGSCCSWILISCSGSSFFHIRIAYHSSFVHGSFSNWQFIYLSDYLPRRHTFTCFPGLLMSAFWSSLPFFCFFHSLIFSEQWFCCFMVAFTQITFYFWFISIYSSCVESNLQVDTAQRFSVLWALCLGSTEYEQTCVEVMLRCLHTRMPLPEASVTLHSIEDTCAKLR